MFKKLPNLYLIAFKKTYLDVETSQMVYKKNIGKTFLFLKTILICFKTFHLMISNKSNRIECPCKSVIFKELYLGNSLAPCGYYSSLRGQ